MEEPLLSSHMSQPRSEPVTPGENQEEQEQKPLSLDMGYFTEMEKQYHCLVVDPPWNQGKTGLRSVRPRQTKTLDYPTMSREELLLLPIRDWATKDAYLWLWATNSKDRSTGEPILHLAFELLDAWGFTYYTMITWDKRTGPCPFGPYQVTTEHLLFGYRGKCIFSKESLGKMQTCFRETPSGVHSEKPQRLYDDIVQYFPGPRLDIFARQRRPGFDGWGNEYGTLEEEVGQDRLL